MIAPFFQSGRATLYHADHLDVLRQMPADSVDSCVTDGPYGIRFMGKAWDGADIERMVATHRRKRGMNTVKQRANIHPTVKPTALMRWLVRLVTPKDGTCLDHMAGSGSTGKAALLEDRIFIGIEKEKIYMPLCKGRIVEAMGELFAQ